MNILSLVGDAFKAVTKTGTRAASGVFQFASDANEVLKAVQAIFVAGDDEAVLNLAAAITRRMIQALAPRLPPGMTALWSDVFANGINADTITFMFDHRLDLLGFFASLAEPAKLYALADSINGSSNPDDEHRADNEYNELDMTVPMNRHALICQIQRLAKSCSFILANGIDRDTLERIDMDTLLKSDGSPENTAVYSAATAIGGDPPIVDEEWICINGVAGEYFWLKLMCHKLRDRFSRNITGVFNRSDGVLWDLIECSSERFSDEAQEKLLRRTISSHNAQQALQTQFFERLFKPGVESKSSVVVVAHSQGCLVLRLVLEHFAKTGGPRVWDIMRTRLHVFTFGNPSVHWKVVQDQSEQKDANLYSYAKVTEHFANRKDFVANLGILKTYIDRESGYLPETTFINENPEWVGHLFGTQYSLKKEHYVHGENSTLLSRQ